jgi:hypothetical protein
MPAGRCRAFRIVPFVIGAFAATALSAADGIVEGTVTFPGRTVPAATVYAREIDSGALHETTLRRGQNAFRLELPPGRYWLFMRPNEPGLAELYGAHTRYSACQRQQDAAACEDHTLLPIEVAATGKIAATDIDDWFLEEAQAVELDRILGAPGGDNDAELGRPRFSEYRAPSASLPAGVKLNAGAAAQRAAELMPQLEAAAASGANFAGTYNLVQVACGDGCRQVALIDLQHGNVYFPELLARLQGALPCRSEDALSFREDSRLLEYTRRDGEAAVTDYLLWDVERAAFTALAQYRRNLARFCGAAAVPGS